MEKKTNRICKEIKLDDNGKGMDKFYKNPLTRTYQYEYALYKTVSGLFASVRCWSKCVDSLQLYFMELPHKAKNAGNIEIQVAKWGDNRRKTQESFLEEMRMLVERDVTPHVIFPMRSACSAEVTTMVEKDGTHRFFFSDGIYGFSLHLAMSGKGHPERILVEKIIPAEKRD